VKLQVSGGQIEVEVPSREIEVPDYPVVVCRADEILAGVAELGTQMVELTAAVEKLVDWPGPPPVPVYELPDPYKGVRGQCSTGAAVEQMKARMDALAEAGCTMYLYPNWAGGVYHQSDLVSHANCVTAEWDPLAEVIAYGHQLGMQVHALVIAALTLVGEHPEWNLQNTAGTTAEWFDFRIQEAQECLAVYCEELVAAYNVDGLVLDYCRGPYPEYAKADIPCEAVIDQVRLIREYAHTARPGLPIGMTPSADANFARQYWRQDWATMLEEGLLDHCQCMCYEGNDGRDHFDYWMNTWPASCLDRIHARVSTWWFEPERARKRNARVLFELQEYWDRNVAGLALYDDRAVAGDAELVQALAAGGW